MCTGKLELDSLAMMHDRADNGNPESALIFPVSSLSVKEPPEPATSWDPPRVSAGGTGPEATPATHNEAGIP